MQYSWHGQSCVQIKTDTGKTILIDPYITGNPLSDLHAETVEADVIILTHGHNDHVGDTEQIAKRTDALIIGNAEIADYFSFKGLKTHGMHIGGQHVFDFGTVKLTPAIHGSTLQVGNELITLGIAAGILFTENEKTIYHAGDTALFTDMKLIGEQQEIDVAFLPIGDNYTMGPADASLAAQFIKAKKVIPMHYNTFPLISQNPVAFIERLEEGQGYVPAIGEVMTLSSSARFEKEGE
ncbi:metal-dependent hydrolase [Isobaculum melis]|uniref:UPF0173 metal-dependent hydrolase SAMN04488559_10525 n=1 Tax=Isobaculum melis TaxID=142588 RepID=A0A1H9RRG0_9LACT|nr:metal-dependent hydrolase [Isobaculum melis]SER75382.1 L-ascorbate metabolism protein UlaG, beta-lactamase superfamily [Isobaculum melis]